MSICPLGNLIRLYTVSFSGATNLILGTFPVVILHDEKLCIPSSYVSVVNRGVASHAEMDDTNPDSPCHSPK